MKKQNIILITFALSLLGLGSCKKDYTVDKEGVFKPMSGETTLDIYEPYGPSWSAPGYGIPFVTKFYYCGSATSPLGGNYTRYHFQIDVDNDTKKALKFGKILEYRFVGGSNWGTAGDDYRIYETTPSASSWPRCYFVDLKANEPYMPKYVILGLKSTSSSPFYPIIRTLENPPAWSGLIVSGYLGISRTFTWRNHPSGYGVDCP